MEPWRIRYQTPDGTLIHEEQVAVDDYATLPRVIFKGGACFCVGVCEVEEAEPRVLKTFVLPVVPFDSKEPVWRDGETEFYWRDGRLTKDLVAS